MIYSIEQDSGDVMELRYVTIKDSAFPVRSFANKELLINFVSRLVKEGYEFTVTKEEPER